MKIHKITLVLLIMPFITQPAEVRGRNIAVLAYGSVINDPGDMRIQGSFARAPFKMPIRMSRASRWPGFPNPVRQKPGRKFAMTIDPNASDATVYYARSGFTNLPTARDDLAEREGSPNRKNIAYIRTLRRGQRALASENFSGSGWAGNIRQLPRRFVAPIIRWANGKGYDAVMWTSLPANIPTGVGERGRRGREILPYLRQDGVLLRNTQAYIRGLPEDIKTPLLRRIEQGNLRD